MIRIFYAASERFFEDEGEKFLAGWKDEGEVTRVSGIGLDAGGLESHLRSKGIFSSVTLLHLRQADVPSLTSNGNEM